MEITSNQNPKLKLLRKLKSKKYRDRQGAFILEGIRSITLALEEASTLEGIFVERSSKEKYEKILYSLPSFPKDQFFIVEDEWMKSLYETDSPQGILAIVRKDPLDFHRIWNESMGRIVLLDHVQDPGNLGTIIRTAEGAGYDLVVCTKECADVYNAKTIRATMGSVVTMNIADQADGIQILSFLKGKGYKVFCASLQDSKDFRKVKKIQPHVLILGNEGAGIREELLILGDENVKIPMHGKAESLNVAVAAGILLYHFADAT